MEGMTCNWSNEIFRFRQQHSLKQAVFAEMVGVDQATVSRWEKGCHSPDSMMQRRILALIQRTPTQQQLHRYLVRTALSAVVLLDINRTIIAASARYCEAHGLAHAEVIGRSASPIYNEEGNRFWQCAREYGLYRGALASATLVTLTNALSGRKPNIFTKEIWTLIRQPDGETVLRGERRHLAEGDFARARDENGGPMRFVTMEELVRYEKVDGGIVLRRSPAPKDVDARGA